MNPKFQPIKLFLLLHLSPIYSSSSFFSMPNDGWLNYISHYPINFWPNHMMIREQMTQEIGMPMPIDAPSYAVSMEPSGHSISTDITYAGSGTFFAFPLTLEVSGSWQEIKPKKNGQHLGLAKPARNQRKQEGIKRFAHHHHFQKSSSICSREMATSFASDKPTLPHIKQKLNIVLTKKLSSTDVNVGRIVLPKWEAENYLPYLRNGEGIHLTVRDIFSSDAWDMRFRFWLNNGDRMYLLGNAGSFIRKYSLECGDFIALYQDESKNIQYICCRKRNEPLPLSMIRGEVVHSNQMVRQTNKHPEQGQSRGGSSNGSNTTNAPTITEYGDPISTEITEPSTTRDGLYIDAQVNINYCNFPEFDEFPDLDKYTLYAPIEMEGSAPMVTEITEPSSARHGLSIDTQLEDINDCSIPDFEEQRSAPIVMEGSAPAMTEITEPSSGRNGLCIDTQLEISNSCHLSEFKEFSDYFDEHGLSAPTMESNAPTMTEITESSSPRDGLHIYTQMEENNDCDLLEFEQFPGFDEYGLSAPSVMDGSGPCMSKTTESSSARDGLNTDTQLENIKGCDIPETEFQGFDEHGYL